MLRNDELITVGTTSGLVAGSSSFTFDGSAGTPDYRNFEPVLNEISGRGVLVKEIDYKWNISLGKFDFVKPGDQFVNTKEYLVHFQMFDNSNPVRNYAIVNYSFFVREINLPNILPTSGKVNNVLQRLDSYISTREKECLLKILGYPLYKLLLSEDSTRMTELMFGAEFELCGETRFWKGIVNSRDCSLLANYIYFFERRDMATQTTGVNTQIPKGEAAVIVSSIDKMCNAWNSFSLDVYDMAKFLWNKKVDGARVYPEFTFDQEWKTLNFSRPINKFNI